jgi:hypothetical protein
MKKLHVEGSIGILKIFMIHYTYKGLTNLLQKDSCLVSNIFDKGKSNLLSSDIQTFLSFFSSYILKRFYGWDSRFGSSVNAYGVFSLCKNNFNRKV